MRRSRMLIRICTILALVLAGVPMVGSATPPAREHAQARVMPACCQRATTRSCCDEAPLHCPQSGGPCRCAARDIPQPSRQPAMPRVESQRQIVLGLSRTPTLVAVLPEATSPRTQVAMEPHPRARSHNTARALLGIWST